MSGFSDWRSDNMNVRNNQIASTGLAINLGFADNSLINANNMSSNNGPGMYIAFSNNVAVLGNNADNNGNLGFGFQDVGESKINDNVVKNSIQRNIDLIRVVDSEFNNNTVIGGNTSFEISPSDVNTRNVFSNNTLKSYHNYGFYMWGTTNNIFYNNSMSDGTPTSLGVYWIDQIEGFNRFIKNRVEGGYTGMYIPAVPIYSPAITYPARARLDLHLIIPRITQ